MESLLSLRIRLRCNYVFDTLYISFSLTSWRARAAHHLAATGARLNPLHISVKIRVYQRVSQSRLRLLRLLNKCLLRLLGL